MNSKQWTALGVVLALLGLTTLGLNRVNARQRLGPPAVKIVAQSTLLTNGVVARTNSVYLPAKVPGFSSEPVPVQQIEVSWLPKDTLFGRRVYGTEDGQYSNVVSVVLMGTDRTSIHKPQFCLVSQGWSIDEAKLDTVRISSPSPYDLPVMKLTTSKFFRDTNGQPVRMRTLYVYWFVAPQELTASHIERMWWMARDLVMTGVLQRWAYVSCLTSCYPGQEEAAYAKMKSFLASTVPEFQLTSGKG